MEEDEREWGMNGRTKGENGKKWVKMGENG